jgi:hypothetical protein
VADEPEVPEQKATTGGYDVFWEPAHVAHEEIEAELPDGTRVKAVPLLGGRRVGFDRPLPRGTQLFLRGKPAWQRVGESG